MDDRLSREAYAELRWHCRQYEQKKRAARAMLGVGASHIDGMPRAAREESVTERTAEKRARYLRDVERIEQCAREVGGGWEKAILLNCCHGVSYDHLPYECLPTCNRSAFFRARRLFFRLLYEKKMEDV